MGSHQPHFPSLSIHTTSPSLSTCPTDSISPTAPSYHSSPNKSTHPSTTPLFLDVEAGHCVISHVNVGRVGTLALTNNKALNKPLIIIKSGYKGCPKDDSCKYAHPKIFLLSHRCDCVKCYLYHATGTVRPNLNQDIPRNTVPDSRPTPLMHIRLPPRHHFTP